MTDIFLVNNTARYSSGIIFQPKTKWHMGGFLKIIIASDVLYDTSSECGALSYAFKMKQVRCIVWKYSECRHWKPAGRFDQDPQSQCGT